MPSPDFIINYLAGLSSSLNAVHPPLPVYPVSLRGGGGNICPPLFSNFWQLNPKTKPRLLGRELRRSLRNATKIRDL